MLQDAAGRGYWRGILCIILLMNWLQRWMSLCRQKPINYSIDYFSYRATWNPLILLDIPHLKQRTLTPSFQGSNPCSPVFRG